MSITKDKNGKKRTPKQIAATKRMLAANKKAKKAAGGTPAKKKASPSGGGNKMSDKPKAKSTTSVIRTISFAVASLFGLEVAGVLPFFQALSDGATVREALGIAQSKFTSFADWENLKSNAIMIIGLPMVGAFLAKKAPRVVIGEDPFTDIKWRL